MTPSRPNKGPMIALAIVGALIVLFLSWDYIHPFAKGSGGTSPEDMSKATTTASGLKYIDLKVGDGASPKPGQQVTVHYTGTLDDGSQFDSSRTKNQPFSFTIGKGQVIKGWDEGVMTMKVGGRRQLIIPSDLGYGAQGASTIPPNATLHFDVELLGIQ